MSISSDKANALLVAREEYTLQLIDILEIEIYKQLRALWRDALERSEAHNQKNPHEKKSPYLMFQKNLKLIKDWNNNTLSEAVDDILQHTDQDNEFFDNLLMIIFKANAKIYAIIRQNENLPINMTVPSFKTFLHRVYIIAADVFFENPFLFEDRRNKFTAIEIQKNLVVSKKIIDDAIRRAIRKSLPIKNMAKEYLVEPVEPEPVPEPEHHSKKSKELTPEDEEKIDEHRSELDKLSNKLSVKKSERIAALIEEEIAAAKSEKSDLAKHLTEMTSTKTKQTQASKKSAKLPSEIPQKEFDEILSLSVNKRPVLKVASGKTVDSDEEPDDDEVFSTRKVIIPGSEIYGNITETILIDETKHPSEKPITLDELPQSYEEAHAFSKALDNSKEQARENDSTVYANSERRKSPAASERTAKTAKTARTEKSKKNIFFDDSE